MHAKHLSLLDTLIVIAVVAGLVFVAFVAFKDTPLMRPFINDLEREMIYLGRDFEND